MSKNSSTSSAHASKPPCSKRCRKGHHLSLRKDMPGGRCVSARQSIHWCHTDSGRLQERQDNPGPGAKHGRHLMAGSSIVVTYQEFSKAMALTYRQSLSTHSQQADVTWLRGALPWIVALLVGLA